MPIITGIDPLGVIPEYPLPNDILEDSIKATVLNILKSYTGLFDVFSEAIQNSLDATQKRKSLDNVSYQPRIWLEINMRDGIIRVIDNGIGMSYGQFILCFRPMISFKRQDDLRGNKGVGATFLAYGFNNVRIYTKQNNESFGYLLRSGRNWVEDASGKTPRPLLEEIEFIVPELANEASGTAIEITLTRSGNEKPKDLGWLGAKTSKGWFNVLRITTPIGGTYLRTAEFKPEITIKVTDKEGHSDKLTSNNAEYYYPHEIEGIKAVDLMEIRGALKQIDADPHTSARRLSDKYKNLDCIYEIWTHDEILNQDSQDSRILRIQLSEDEKILIEQHQVAVYAAQMSSARTFEVFNDLLGLRPTIKLMRGGLQLASDYMPQGELLIIPLKRYQYYGNTTHVIVHFSHGAPDLGRKTFQPELKKLAEDLSVAATNSLISYRHLFKPDTGARVVLAPSKDLHEWKKSQESWREQNPLMVEGISPNISYLSSPREEQDVIAIFHELIGSGIIKGIHFFSTTHHDRYDSLIEFTYTSKSDHLFNAKTNPLGVNNEIALPFSSDPKVLEYKFEFESILDDFSAERKFEEQIDLVVCWTTSQESTENIILKPFLIDNAGNNRHFYGSTHSAYVIGQLTRPVFEVLILEDLIRFLKDPKQEKARQKLKYEIL